MATHIFPRQTGHRHNSVISSSKASGFEAGPQERLKEGIHDLQLQPQERQQSREGQQSTSPCLEVLCEMLFWRDAPLARCSWRDAPLARCSWRDAPMARCSGQMLWPNALFQIGGLELPSGGTFRKKMGRHSHLELALGEALI